MEGAITQFTYHDRQKIDECKMQLTQLMRTNVNEKTEDSVLIAALAELTVELSFALVGPALTLRLLNELAGQVIENTAESLKQPSAPLSKVRPSKNR